MNIKDIIFKGNNLIVMNEKGYEYFYSLSECKITSKRGIVKNNPFPVNGYADLRGIKRDIGLQLCRYRCSYDYNFIKELLKSDIVCYDKIKEKGYFKTSIGVIICKNFNTNEITFDFEEKGQEWKPAPFWLASNASRNMELVPEVALIYCNEISQFRSITSFRNSLWQDTHFIEYCVKNKTDIDNVHYDSYLQEMRKQKLIQKYGANRTEQVLNYINHFTLHNTRNVSDEYIDYIAKIMPIILVSAKKIEPLNLTMEEICMMATYFDKLDATKSITENKKILENYKNKIIDDIFKEIKERYKKIENETFKCEDSEYCVIFPENYQDCVNEGEQQHNCVGTCCSYKDGVVNKIATIFFIRNVNNKNASLITCYYNFTREYRESRGYCNANITSEQREIFNKICEEINEINNKK